MKPFCLLIAGCAVMIMSLFAAAALKFIPTSDLRMVMFAVFMGGFVCLVVGAANLMRD